MPKPDEPGLETPQCDQNAPETSREATDGKPCSDDQSTCSASDTKSDETVRDVAQSQELTPPPMPPRPPTSQAGSLRLSKRSERPQLLSTPTTALSSTNVHTQTHHATGPSPLSSPASRAVSRKHSFTHFGRFVGTSGTSDGEDSASLKSYIPSLDARLDDESIIGDVIGDDKAPPWKLLSTQAEEDDPFESLPLQDGGALEELILEEFDDIPSVGADGVTDDDLVAMWKAKLKHFFILSASGKPVYSRYVQLLVSSITQDTNTSADTAMIK